jgi:diguanylate cyclase (GGDEF)-like protein/PAS domain S-box-containing protein
MKQRLRILSLEDNEDDFELTRANIARQGISCEMVRVETREAFVGALTEGGFDLILADYSLPSFNGLFALEIAREKSPGLPFIFVSGAIGEEFAVETLKRGATDYVLKDRLSRLGSAINRALIEVEEQTARVRAEKELENYRMNLEELVKDRTIELNKTNERLQRELAERRRAEETLYRREQEFAALVENAPDIVQRFDRELRHLYINPAVNRLTDVSPQEFIGRTYRELGFPENVAVAWEKALWDSFETGLGKVIEFEMPTRQGQRFIEARLVPEFSKSGFIESVLAISRDITDRKKVEERLHTASITDELTGLFNRRGFLIFGQKQCEIAKRYKRHFSILFLDLDGMKKINDTFGHKDGDQALVDIAAILRKTFREADIIARIGGDEFTVLITDPPGSEIKKTVDQHVEENLAIHNERTRKGYTLSVSMGMVHYDPEHSCSLEELLNKADELMYENKQDRQLKEEMRQLSRRRNDQERLHDRHEIGGHDAVELHVSGVSVIENISLGGISVRTSQRLTKGAVYGIRIRADANKELSLKGIVVWSSAIRGVRVVSDKDTSCYLAGLRFVEVTELMLNSLEKLILSLGG